MIDWITLVVTEAIIHGLYVLSEVRAFGRKSFCVLNIVFSLRYVLRLKKQLSIEYIFQRSTTR